MYLLTIVKLDHKNALYYGYKHNLINLKTYKYDIRYKNSIV